MATRDTSHNSDISKMKASVDGSFNRLPSVFRDFIEPGGKFAPEKGGYGVLLVPYHLHGLPTQAGTISTSHMRVVSLNGAMEGCLWE